MTRTYTDVMGRTQHAVDGPKGTYLVTRSKPWGDFTIWRSDSIRTAGTAATLESALARARGLAGVKA
jgi:hypothetical protein